MIRTDHEDRGPIRDGRENNVTACDLRGQVRATRAAE